MNCNISFHSYQFHKGDLFIYQSHFWCITQNIYINHISFCLSLLTKLSTLATPATLTFSEILSYMHWVLQFCWNFTLFFFSFTDKLKTCNTSPVRCQLSLVNSFSSHSLFPFLILSPALFRISCRWITERRNLPVSTKTARSKEVF